jgi:uncharacterized protein (DUF433 family)
MDWKRHITFDPAVCDGQACIRGTRVLVSVVLDNLAIGEPTESICRGYQIERSDVEAALRYAEDLAKEQVVSLRDGA